MQDLNENNDVIQAHKHSLCHRSSIMKDKKCGCFYCLKIFSPTEILDWIDDNNTAICPYCGIDSVIGESCGYPITTNFLNDMNSHWFS